MDPSEDGDIRVGETMEAGVRNIDCSRRQETGPHIKTTWQRLYEKEIPWKLRLKAAVGVCVVRMKGEGLPRGGL